MTKEAEERQERLKIKLEKQYKQEAVNTRLAKSIVIFKHRIST